MAFVAVVLLLVGLGMLFSAIGNISLIDWLKGYLPNQATKAGT